MKSARLNFLIIASDQQLWDCIGKLNFLLFQSSVFMRLYNNEPHREGGAQV